MINIFGIGLVGFKLHASHFYTCLLIAGFFSAREPSKSFFGLRSMTVSRYLFGMIYKSSINKDEITLHLIFMNFDFKRTDEMDKWEYVK